MMNLSPAKKRFVELASATYGDGAVITRDEVKALVKEHGLGWVSCFVRAPYRVGTGKFKLPVAGETITPIKPKKVKVPVMKKSEIGEESVVAYHNPTENLVQIKTHCMFLLVTTMMFTVLLSLVDINQPLLLVFLETEKLSW